jgi:hypothetical protein
LVLPSVFLTAMAPVAGFVAPTLSEVTSWDQDTLMDASKGNTVVHLRALAKDLQLLPDKNDNARGDRAGQAFNKLELVQLLLAYKIRVTLAGDTRGEDSPPNADGFANNMHVDYRENDGAEWQAAVITAISSHTPPLAAAVYTIVLDAGGQVNGVASTLLRQREGRSVDGPPPFAVGDVVDYHSGAGAEWKSVMIATVSSGADKTYDILMEHVGLIENVATNLLRRRQRASPGLVEGAPAPIIVLGSSVSLRTSQGPGKQVGTVVDINVEPGEPDTFICRFPHPNGSGSLEHVAPVTELIWEAPAHVFVIGDSAEYQKDGDGPVLDVDISSPLTDGQYHRVTHTAAHGTVRPYTATGAGSGYGSGYGYGSRSLENIDRRVVDRKSVV